MENIQYICRCIGENMKCVAVPPPTKVRLVTLDAMLAIIIF